MLNRARGQPQRVLKDAHGLRSATRQRRTGGTVGGPWHMQLPQEMPLERPRVGTTPGVG